MITTDPAPANPLFPLFVKAEELSMLLIGAGPVGVEKATGILTNSPGCKLVIVAEMVSHDMRALTERFPLMIVHERRFEESDLDGVQILIVAINNREYSKEIREMAHARNILVNVADTPDLCDFYLGSVVRKGDLKIAISTNGKSPTVAKRMKEWLNDVIPDDIQLLLDNMRVIRSRLKTDFAQKVSHLNEITSAMVKDNKKDE